MAELFGVAGEQVSDSRIRARMEERVRRAVATPDGAANLGREHLVSVALEARAGFPFRDGGGPNDQQWRAMATMASESVVVERRNWGRYSGHDLRERLENAAGAALRSTPGGERLLVLDAAGAQRILMSAFEAEKASIERELGGAEQPDGFQWLALRHAALNRYFLHLPLFEAWQRHPEARNMTVMPGRPPIWQLDGGRYEQGDRPIAETSDGLREMIRFLASPQGIESKVWTAERPEVELALPDGCRLTAVIDPVCPTGPFVTLRRHLRPRITLDQYRADNGVGVVELLKAMMRAKLSILIAGGTNSGKTTALRALGGCFDKYESVVVAESVQELRYEDHPDLYGHGIYPLVAQPPGLNGGGVTLGECVTIAQRMSPDRIVVGEIRGPEVEGLVTAAKMGHPLMSTIHGASGTEGLLNLARSHEQFSQASFENSLAQMCSVLDVVVSIDTIDDRFVFTSVGLVNGLRPGPTPEIDELYGPKPDGTFGFLVSATNNVAPQYRTRLERVGLAEILGEPTHWADNGSRR